MKKNILSRFCVLLVLLLALPMAMQAQANRKSSNKYAKNKLDLHQIHNFSMWGGVGYSGFVNKYSDSKFIGGAGGMLGLGYEWHYKNFMLSVGPEFRILSSQDKYEFPHESLFCPLEGSNTKYFQFDNFRENQTAGQIMLPIMFGGEWEDANVPMYFMAGAKVGYTLFDMYKQKSPLTTYARDNAAMDDWYDIPSHDLVTSDFVSKGKNNFGLDVTLSAEVGVLIDPLLSVAWQKANDKRKYPWHMRAGLFIDYGMPILKNGGDAELASIKDVNTVETNSLHGSTKADSKLNSLLVGAKFTALLQLNRPKKPKPQKPYMVVRLMDSSTQKPLNPSGVVANVTALSNNRTTKRTPSSQGMLVQRLNPGEYSVAISKPGYLPVDPVKILLIEGENNNLKMKLDTTYVWFTPEPVFRCTVRNSKTGELVAATVNIVDNAEDKTVATMNYTPSSAAEVKLPMGHEYSAVISAPNFHSKKCLIGEQTVNSIDKVFDIDPIEKRTFIIRNLFFATNQTTILPQSEKALQNLYDFLNENPNIRIRITGHTDWVGSDASNQKLSEGRAASVRKSMIDRGIDGSRIETEGKGESQPIDTNETEQGRQNNRRVEFTIIEGELGSNNVLEKGAATFDGEPIASPQSK